MNPVDPKWLEILKASSWQTLSLALACLMILLLIRSGTMPTNDNPIWIALPMVGFVIFGCLGIGGAASSAANYFRFGQAFAVWREKKRDMKKVENYIPYMTNQDKAVIGYLLHHNLRMFHTLSDAAGAAPLLTKGIIRIALKNGQYYNEYRIPFEVPDHIWEVLEKHRYMFPYTPSYKGKAEVYPWATNWMAS